MPRRVRQLLPGGWTQEGSTFLTLAVLLAIFALTQPVFLSARNWEDLGRSYFVELGLLTVAATIVLLTRGIDLSVAAVLALSSVTLGKLHVDAGLSIWVAILGALAVGLGAGLLNGLLVVRLRLSPIVATLATLTLYRGISLGLTRGSNLGPYPHSFQQLGQGEVGGIPLQAFVLCGVAAVVVVVLRRTLTGRWIYATGGNERAARLAGIPTGRIVIGVYAAAGLIAAIAGIVAAARFNTARSDFADGSELDAITAAILGGVSIAGGRGSALWALAGALCIAVLRNGMTLLNYSGFLQIVAIGLILLAAVLADRVVMRLRVRREISALLDNKGLRPPDPIPDSAQGGTPA